jgi:hypothetical protein
VHQLVNKNFDNIKMHGMYVKSIGSTQEDAVDPHSVCTVPWHSRQQRGKTHTACQKRKSVSPRDFAAGRHLLWVLFITSVSQIETQRTIQRMLYYFTLTKRDNTSVQCVYNWKTVVTGQKQGVVSFPQHKPLLSPNLNSTVHTTRNAKTDRAKPGNMIDVCFYS